MPRPSTRGGVNATRQTLGVKGEGQPKKIQPSVAPGKKRGQDENASKKSGAKRPAFGDITNAVLAGKQSLKSQVKEGLSNIVSLHRRASLGGGSKRFKLAQVPPTNESGTSIEEEELEVEDSQSLPSSQEEFGSKIRREVSLDDDEEDDSEYESAEENDENLVPQPNHRYEAPPRVVPPVGINDFDLENWDDSLQCSEYAMHIFEYYKSREGMFRCPDYMPTQPEINKSMRAILIDWLVEVQESFELNHETLYTAVKLMDLFLSRRKVKREDLQLIGATACLIACKIDERIPPLLEDFVYVCDGAYTRRQIITMEREMICSVDFDVGYPLTYRFLRRYGRVCKVTMPVLTFARYILEMALMDYQLNVETSESELAAAALILAFNIKNINGWTDTLKFYSGYTMEDVTSLVLSLHSMLLQPHKDNLKTIRQKYSHKVFHEVALIEIPDKLVLSKSG